MNVVINSCFGGFGLSVLAIEYYLKLKGKECFMYIQTAYRHREGKEKYELQTAKQIEKDSKYGCIFVFTNFHGDYFNEWPKEENDGYFNAKDIKRNDPDLVKTVIDLGDKANGHCAKLTIVEIPDDVEWYIHEYDGSESVNEQHRSWG